MPTGPVDCNGRESDLPQLPGAPRGARKPGATKNSPKLGSCTEWCKYIVPESCVCSEMKKVINAQFFTNRRKLEQNKILISTILLSSFPCSNYKQTAYCNK